MADPVRPDPRVKIIEQALSHAVGGVHVPREESRAALYGLAADLEQATHDTKEQRAIAGNWRQLYEREQKRLEAAREALRPFTEVDNWTTNYDGVGVIFYVGVSQTNTEIALRRARALAAGSVAPPDGKRGVSGRPDDLREIATWLETTRRTVHQHSRDSDSWWIGAAYGLLDEIDSLTADLADAREWADTWETRSDVVVETMERYRVRATAAEADLAEMRSALVPFFAYPRWLSIGSTNNGVEIRVSRESFDRAKAAFNALADCPYCPAGAIDDLVVAMQVRERDANDSGERLTLEELCESLDIDPDGAVSPTADRCAYCAGKGGRYRTVGSRFLGTEMHIHEGPWESCERCEGTGIAPAPTAAGHEGDNDAGAGSG